MINVYISEAPDRDRLVKKSCFSIFHEHFHPGCKKTYPLNDLIFYIHWERVRALKNYEQDTYRCYRRDLSKAIPHMSAVLGGQPWIYSNKYSAKQAMEIYIYFLTFFLTKNNWFEKHKKCSCSNKTCEFKLPIQRQEYQRFIIDNEYNPIIAGCKEGCFESKFQP